MHKPARGQQDPLSAASAGLLALGIGRRRRTEVLELLSAMLDLADVEGHVRLDRPLYNVEERLGIDESLEAYGWLEQLGVATRTNSGWRIADFGAHAGPAGDTLASVQVLRRHFATIGAEHDEVVLPPVPAFRNAKVVVPKKRWRRAVPMAAAGIAASVAVVTGVAQLVPQAAVTGRNAAAHSAAPTSAATGTGTVGATRGTVAAVPRLTAPATVVTTPSPSTVVDAPPGGLAGNIGCVAQQVVAAVTSVDAVPLASAGDQGQTIWAAVVKGTATVTDSAGAVVLPALSVVGHLDGGDTEAVLATLGAAVLPPDTATPFSAVISLGDTQPRTPVTASATAAGPTTCP